MSVTLTHGISPNDTVVVLPNQTIPYEHKRIKKHNVHFLTDGGTDYVYNKGITKYLYVMNMVITSETTIDELRSFFDTTVNGMVETFTMSDPYDDEATVRFNQQELNIIEHKKQAVYEVNLEFVSA